MLDVRVGMPPEVVAELGALGEGDGERRAMPPSFYTSEAVLAAEIEPVAVPGDRAGQAAEAVALFEQHDRGAVIASESIRRRQPRRASPQHQNPPAHDAEGTPRSRRVSTNTSTRGRSSAELNTALESSRSPRGSTS